MTGKITIRAQEFLDSPEGIRAYEELVAMAKNVSYNTNSTYSPRSDNGDLSFVDKHMTYLCSHQGMNAAQYVSNLRLITKINN
jgi:hypothetical protein